MPNYVYVLMLRRKTGNWITKMLKVTLWGYNSERSISLYWTSLSSVFSQSSIINAFRRKRTAAFAVRRNSWRANSEMAPGLLPPGCVPGIISSPECGGTASIMGCHSPTLRFCVWLKKCWLIPSRCDPLILSSSEGEGSRVDMSYSGGLCKVASSWKISPLLASEKWAAMLAERTGGWLPGAKSSPCLTACKKTGTQ